MKQILLCAVLSLGVLNVNAQNPYHPDSTFSDDGIAIITGDVSNKYRPMLVATQGDKTVMVGYKTFVESMQVIRLKANGTPDSTFNGNGIASLQIVGTYPSVGFICRSMATTADKIYIASYWGGVSFSGIAVYCYNNNGTLDNTFGTAGVVKTNILAQTIPSNILIQSDGKLVITGTTIDAVQIPNQNVYKYGAVRLNTNGTVDNTYGVNGKITCSYPDYNIPHIGTEGANFPYGAVLQSDDKLVVSGSVGHAAGFENNTFVIRHKTNGTVDSTFGTNGRFQFHKPDYQLYNRSMAMDAQGNFYIAMYIQALNGPCDSNWAVGKLNNTGALVNTYGNAGVSYLTLPVRNDNGIKSSFAVQADGRVIIAGQDSIVAQNFTACRLTLNGSPDNTFSNGPTVKIVRGAMDECMGVTIQPDGKIVMAGSDSSGYDGLCMRITDDYLSTAITNISGERKINIYPNPINGEEFYISTKDVQGSVTVKIYNTSGMLVSNASYSASNTIACRFPSGLAAGIYYINATLQDGSIKTLKVVKEK